MTNHRAAYAFNDMEVGSVKTVFNEGNNEASRAIAAARSFGGYHGWRFQIRKDKAIDAVHITRVD